MPSNHLILCRPHLLLPSIFPTIRIFSNKSGLHIRWPKYWSFSFSISPSNEDSGLIFFRIDWFDLLAVQGTLESLLQHHSSKASSLQCSAFFMVQLSHPYMSTGKTIALTIWTFVSKVHSMDLNKCRVTRVHHYRFIQSSFTALKSSVLHLFPLWPQSLATTGPFTFSMVLPFPKCHKVGLIQYAAFPDWLLFT